MRSTAALLACLLVLCGLAACAETGDPATPGPDAPLIRRAAVQASLPGMWRLSPLSYRGGFQSKTLIYETLVRRDETGRIVPDLAESWRFEEDGRIVILTLREGALFHDGTPVTAEAVRMHFKRWVGLPEHAWLGANQRIVDVRAESAREVRIELDEPYALLADLCAINPCAIRGPGALDGIGEFVGPVGTGPFRFLGTLDDGRTFRLERTSPQGEPVPTGLFLDLVPFQRAGRRTAYEALRKKDVDIIVDGWYEHVPRERVADIIEDEDLDFLTGPGSSVVYLSFRLDGPTADRYVRRRVAAVVDRAALIEAAELGFADACYAWAAPSVTFWPAGGPTIEPADTARAWTELVFIAQEAEPREVARATELVAQIRRDAGEVELRVLSPEDYETAVANDEYDLRLEATWGIPYEPYVSLRVRFLPPAGAPSAARDRFLGVDPRVTELVREASRQPTLDGRVPVYARIQELMEREALVVPLFVPQRLGACRTDVPGWRMRLDHDLHRTGYEALFCVDAEAEDAAARSALELTPRGREAFERLREAKRFTDDAIYDGGCTPNEVIALRHLWQEPHAAEAFALLERQATLPGRLYALCGMFYTDRDRFHDRIQTYRHSREKIFFQTGCCGIADQPVRELVERPGDGVVRLRGDQSIREWLVEQDNPDGSAGGYWYDILGGGWPNLFREGGGWYEVQEEEYSEAAD